MDALAKMAAHTGITLAGHDSYVFSVAFSPDGSLLVSAGKDNSLKFWEGKGVVVQEEEDHVCLR